MRELPNDVQTGTKPQREAQPSAVRESRMPMTLAGRCADCDMLMQRWARSPWRDRTVVRCGGCAALRWNGEMRRPLRAGSPPLRDKRLTTVEAARLAHVASEAIRQRCRRGSFATARRDEAGHWTVERGEVEDWMDSQRA